MIEWIAEVGSCHKGEASLAYRMVKEFVDAGATIIKFQAGRDPTDPIRYADDFLPEAFQWCHSWGVEFLASCWSMAGLQMCRDLGMKRRKIAHQQVTLINPIFLETMQDRVETFASIVPTDKTHHNTRYFCRVHEYVKWLAVSNQYPTYIENFRKPVMHHYDGYSNHVPGIAAPLWAVSRGAKIIECHVTLDPTEESVKDNHFALLPHEFATMVRIGNQIARLGVTHE